MPLTFINGPAARICESTGDQVMPRRIVLSAFLTALTAMPAGAADLPTQSRLGAIFADEAPAARVEARQAVAPIIPYNLLPNPLWNRGNYTYGSSWDFYYPGAYYGGPYVSYAARLPYVCGLYGYCR
jgi:hypothetical protein